jgi:hypothetical protein
MFPIHYIRRTKGGATMENAEPFMVTLEKERQKTREEVRKKIAEGLADPSVRKKLADIFEKHRIESLKDYAHGYGI